MSQALRAYNFTVASRFSAKFHVQLREPYGDRSSHNPFSSSFLLETDSLSVRLHCRDAINMAYAALVFISPEPTRFRGKDEATFLVRHPWLIKHPG